MIPPFNQLGYLPPGIHPATLDEIDARCGQLSELRRVQEELREAELESLKRFINQLKEEISRYEAHQLAQ